MSASLFNPKVEELFFEWMSHDCDSQSNIALQQKYDELPGALKEEYGNFFSFAQNISDQKSNFDEETIVLKGFVLRDLMQKSTKMVIRKYTELETACEVKWNFHNALFFAGTVATTIGYGKVTPETFSGRLWCVIYLSVGIPYFAFLTSTLSESLNAKLARFDSALWQNV
ncbi:unnamed protein product [Oikopleura dioica]|uniref:Potassium channel domain-containing protein n=1 Tax=Oikopleura dioica TaxID=34765 RepID=E4XAN7_OIKDI|nr:unnamed protein product [Oikopleura dioica]